LGFSSPTCHKCMSSEGDYADMAEDIMRRFKVSRSLVLPAVDSRVG
jgi:hypothetical protein